MLNFIDQNTINTFDILISIHRMMIAPIIAIIILWICIRIAFQVFDAFKNKTFELTEDWKISFGSKPLRFCLLVLYWFSVNRTNPFHS